jgi:hypothetical protein
MIDSVRLLFFSISGTFILIDGDNLMKNNVCVSVCFFFFLIEMKKKMLTSISIIDMKFNKKKLQTHFMYLCKFQISINFL